MVLNFFTLLTLFSLFTTFLLILFFLFTKKGYAEENKILALLLSVFGLQILFSFFTSNYTFQYFMEWHKPIFLLRLTSFLIGPLIYFYINAFLKRKQVINYKSLLHFIPFLCMLIAVLIYYTTIENFILWRTTINTVATIILLFHNLIYLVLSFYNMYKQKVNFKTLFLNIQNATQNIWIQFLLIGFILIWIINLNTFGLYMMLKRPDWCAFTGSIYALTAFLFVNAIMFYILIRPDGYFILKKYKNSNVKEDEKSIILRKLNNHMEQNKPYLNPEITLEVLANELSVNPRILSQIINETFQKNFKSYIVEYRIKESMCMLIDEKFKKLTILEIIYKVGFNSKSTFNNQFKLLTNLTPMEYRAKVSN